MPRKYGKREFCKSVKCPHAEAGKIFCARNCPHTAYELHDWLIYNTFKILKGGE